MRLTVAALLLAPGVMAPVALGQGAPSTVFQTVTPCRLLDTRLAAGPLGGPALQPGVARTFSIASACGIPSGAFAVAVNATVTDTTGLGFLALYAGDIATPGTSNLSFGARQTRASASIIGVAADGSIKAMVTGGAADFILDVNGYFAANSAPPSLAAIVDQTIPLGSVYSVRLAADDPDRTAVLTYYLDAKPAGATFNPNPVIQWTPTASQVGINTFTARVVDGMGRSDVKTFHVTVTPADRPPSLADQADAVLMVGDAFTRTLTATDPDAGDTLTFALLSAPPGMTLAGATLSWPTAGTTPGDYPVIVKVSDTGGLFDAKRFTVMLRPSAPPVANDDSYVVNIGQTLTVPAPGVLGNDFDPLGRPMTAARLTNPDKGTLNSFNADGSFVYQAPAVVDPVFSPVVRYHVDSRGYSDPPLVADVDGDGKPELIFLGVGGGAQAGINAVRGTDGSVLWHTAALPAPYSDCTAGLFTAGGLYHLAIGDIDDSGQLSIVFPTSCGRDNQPTGIVGTNTARYAALNARDGSFKWLSPPLSRELDSAGNPDGLASGTVPTLARVRPGETPSIVVGLDLTYFLFNGKPECDQLIPGWPANVMCRGVVVLDGKDGAVRQRMAAPTAGAFDITTYGNGYQAAVVADLDGDGNVEFVFGGGVFNNDGSVRSNNNSDGTGYALTFWTGLGNFDDTPDIEVARPEGGAGGSGIGYRLSVYKSDGRLLWSLPLPATFYTGIPAVADVDGTGRPAVVFNVDGNVCAVDYQGNYKWCHDVGAPAGVSNIALGSRVQVYDLDGDGVPEVIVQVNGEILLFLDGATGNVKYSFDLGAANGPPFYPPYLDYGVGGPILGDFDGSGHVSIATLWGGVGRLEVVGAAGNDWRPVRNIFNQESYQFGNVNDDGTMPKFFVNNFATPATNVFGTQPQVLTPVDPRKKVTTSFTYSAADGTLTSAPGTVTITILPPNRPPVFVSTPPTRYVAVAAFSYTAQAVDPDPGDTVTYSLKLAQGNGAGVFGNCTMAPSTGVLSCGILFSGEQDFVIVATDSFGASAYQNIKMFDSAGAATVPNVVGQTLTAARAALTGAGFTTGGVTQIFNSAPAGQVLSQVPTAGASLLLGEAVTLSVSQGPMPVPVPFVVGQGLSVANTILAGAGFTSAVTRVFSNTVPTDQVMAQLPAAGTPVAPTSANPVALTVSAGSGLAVLLTRTVTTADAPIPFTIAATDLDGNPLPPPAPAVTLAITPAIPEFGVNAPVISGGQIVPGPLTAGVFTLTATDSVNSRSASATFAVYQPNPVDSTSNGAEFAKLSEVMEGLFALRTQLEAALAANDAVAMRARLVDMLTLWRTLDMVTLVGSAPVSPPGGFPPNVSQLGPGFTQTAEDVIFKQVLRDAAADLKALQDAWLDPTAPVAQINALNDSFHQRAARLDGLNPGEYGLIDAIPEFSVILGVRNPKMLDAMFSDLERWLANHPSSALAPASPRLANSTLPEQVVTLAVAAIINEIEKPYQKFLRQTVLFAAWTAAILPIRNVLRTALDADDLVAVVSGPSLSFEVFLEPFAFVEGIDLNTHYPDLNAVNLIGPDLPNTVIESFRTLKSVLNYKNLTGQKVQNLDQIKKVLDLFKKSIKTAQGSPFADVQKAAQAAFQVPSEGDSCLFSSASNCGQLIYPDGFHSVYSGLAGLPLPAPILFLVFNGVNGKAAVGTPEFLPCKETMTPGGLVCQ